MSTEMKPSDNKSYWLLLKIACREFLRSLTTREWVFIAIGLFCTILAAIGFYSFGERIGRARGDVETIVRVITVTDKGVERMREFKALE